MKISQGQQTAFRLYRHKVEVLYQLGEDVEYAGRRYRVLRVRVDSGQEYIAVRLYNEKGKFIKQLMMEPQVTGQVGQILLDSAEVLPLPELLRRFPHLLRFKPKCNKGGNDGAC